MNIIWFCEFIGWIFCCYRSFAANTGVGKWKNHLQRGLGWYHEWSWIGRNVPRLWQASADVPKTKHWARHYDSRTNCQHDGLRYDQENQRFQYIFNVELQAPNHRCLPPHGAPNIEASFARMLWIVSFTSNGLFVFAMNCDQQQFLTID